MADSDITINFEGNDNVISIIDSIIDGLNNLNSTIDSSIDSFSNLQASIDSIDSSPFEDLNTEIDATSSSMSSLENTTETMTAQMESSFDGAVTSMDNLGSTTETMESLIDGAVNSIGELGSTTESMATEMSSAFEEVENSMDGLSSASSTMATDMVSSIDEVVGSIEDIGGAVDNASSEMESFGKTGEETASSTNVLSGALGVLGVAASATSFASAIMGADEMNVKLDTLAGITGISSDQMNALKASASSALKGTGVGAKEATVALMQFEQRTGTSNDAVQGFSGSLSDLYVAASRAGVSAQGFANSWSMAFTAWDKGNDVSPRVLKNLGLNAEAASHLKDVYAEYGKESPQFAAAMKEVGDQAAQTAGKTGGLGAIIGEFQKILASTFSLIDTAVKPAATAMAQFIGSMPPAVIQAIGIALISLGAAFTVAGIQAAFAAIGVDSLAAGVAILEAPVVIITAAIVALALGFIWAYQNVGWFRDIVNEVYAALLNFYNTVLLPLGQYLYGVFANAWAQVSAAVSVAWNSYLKPFIDWLGGIFGPMLGQAGGQVNWFGAVWSIASAIIHGVIDRIILTVQTMWTIISNVIGIIGDLLKGDWASAWRRAGTIVQAMVDYVKGMIGNLPAILWGIISAVGSAALSIGKAIFNGIINALKGLGDAIFNAIKNAVKAIPGVGGAIAAAFGWGAVRSYGGGSTRSYGSRVTGLKSSNGLGAVSNITNSNDNRNQTINYNVDVKSAEVSESGIINLLNKRSVIDTINKNLELFK